MRSKKRIIVIGNKSFIQKNFYELCKKRFEIKKIRFTKINSFQFNQDDIVINCSQNKNFFNRNYIKKFDRNFKVAKILSRKNSQLILLSSRNVYKPKLDICENSQLKPIDIYGKNCLKSENNCKSVLKKLTILRLSNVVGIETMKKKRLSLMSVLINGVKEKHVIFDDSYEWYKDLIPIRILCLYLEKILLINYYGVLNIGSGFKIKIKNFIRYLDLNKKIKISVNQKKIKKDEYSYDIKKLKKITKIFYPRKIIIKEFNNIGKLIKKI